MLFPFVFPGFLLDLRVAAIKTWLLQVSHSINSCRVHKFSENIGDSGLQLQRQGWSVDAGGVALCWKYKGVASVKLLGFSMQSRACMMV